MALALGLSLKLSALAQQCGWPLGGASVDLNFAQGRYYGGSLASISTTRASTGYAQTSSGLLVPFASNVPRITNQGLLVEEARTNIVLQSQAITTVGGWTISGASNSANSATAPDGTSTADKLIEDSATSGHLIYQAVTTVNTSVYTSSVYVKPAGRTWFCIDFEDSGHHKTWFDLSGAGAVGTNAAGNTAAITALANGWYRISVSRAISGTTAYSELMLAAADNATTYAGDGASGAYLWQAQIELGAWASSGIVTGAASATRAADVITLTGAARSATNGTVGSVLVQTNGVNTTGSAAYAFGTGTDNFTIRFMSNTLLRTYANNVSLDDTLGSGSAATALKIGYAWSAAGRSIVANNGTVATDANANTAIGNTIYLGSYGSADSPIKGYMTRFTVYPSRLSDVALKALTA